MPEMDPHQPVIVGAGQLSWRPEEGEAFSPLDLMETAARAAAADSGAGDSLLARAEVIGCVESITWPVPDPAAGLAERIGAHPAATLRTIRSGTSPLALLGELCGRIQDGAADVVLAAGAEAWHPFAAALREGRSTGWAEQAPGTEPTAVVGEEKTPSHEAEVAVGLIAPVAYYPLFESAVRGAADRGPEDHRRFLGELWARFAAVAADNPHAWTRDAPGAEEIATPSGENRLVSVPYTKLMNAHIQVDQAAALLICSTAAAEAAGVPRDRWVFPLAAAHADDRWFAVERERLDRSPALAGSARAALGHAGLGIDDMEWLDLYSCFPSAVEVGATELGLDLLGDERAPTVTGGLTFAGGPGSNYVSHSLAAMVHALRESPGSHGLVTGVGWYLSKHAVGVLSSAPPPRPFADHEPEVELAPARAVAAGGAEGTVEAYTALIERDGSASVGIATCLLPDGGRATAKSDDPETLAELVEGDALGLPARVDAEHRLTLV